MIVKLNRDTTNILWHPRRQIINDCSIAQLGEPAKMFPLNQYLCLYSESTAVHAEGMCCSMCFQRNKSVTFCFRVETCML